MNRNQFVFLIVLVAVIGGAGLYLYKQKNESWSDSGDRLGQNVLPEFPLNDVAQVSITSPAGTLDLVRQEEEWTVPQRGGYPANFSQLRDFLRKVWELKVAQPKFVTEAQLNRFDLLLPEAGVHGGTLIDFKDRDGKSIEKLRVGKQHMRDSAGDSPYGGSFPDGRYVMVGDDVKTVALVKDPLSNVDVDPQRWLDKDFFKVDGVKTVTVQAEDGTDRWKLTRDSRTADWQLVEAGPGESLEKSKITSLGSVFSSPSFTDVVVDVEGEQTGFASPRVATLETFDRFTYIVNVGSTNESGNYHMNVRVSADLPSAREPGENESEEDKARLDSEWLETNAKLKEKLEQETKLQAWTYLVAKWTLDPILKQRSDLLSTNAVAEVPFSPLVDPIDRVISEPVRVPPIDEPIIPDPTQPGPGTGNTIPDAVKPRELIQLPPLPNTQPTPGTTNSAPESVPKPEE